MSEKKRWIDLAGHGIFLGDQKMGDGKFRLILLDMNEMADPQKLKAINFVPVKTSPRYSKGVYFLNTDDQQLRPKALAAALGVASCPLVDVDPVEIDKLFREKLKERFNVTLNTITQQSLPLGFNKDGHRVYDTSVGRMVRITPENALLEGSAPAAKVSPGTFLRAKTDNDLNECAEGFMQHILQGEKTNWSDVTKFAKAIFEYEGEPDNMQLRQLQEAIEASAYRQFSQKTVEPTRESFIDAQNMYFSLPISQIRSAESIALQQYSTPLPMAVVAQRLLIGHDDVEGKSLLEPTAGNAGLINALPHSKMQIHAIEYDKKRIEFLSKIPGINVQFGDATAINFKNYLDVPEGFDYTIVNPPFGSMGTTRDFGALKNVGKLDHFIPLRSLESRKDQGRSVFIIGADSNQSKGENKEKTQQFFNYLYDFYEVHGVTELDGRLYARQGANFNTRMIVVGDKRDVPLTLGAPESFNIITTYEDLWQWSENVIAQYTASDNRKRNTVALAVDDVNFSSEALAAREIAKVLVSQYGWDVGYNGKNAQTDDYMIGSATDSINGSYVGMWSRKGMELIYIDQISRDEAKEFDPVARAAMFNVVAQGASARIDGNFDYGQGALFDADEKAVIGGQDNAVDSDVAVGSSALPFVLPVRHVFMPDMTVGKLKRLLSKNTNDLTLDDSEDLKDYKYFLLTDEQSAVEKGFMDTYQQDGGDVHVLKNKYWLVNIDNALEKYHDALPKNTPINEGDQFITESGRVTSPYPKTDYKRDSLNRVNANQWLKDEAIAEANYRRDNFNGTQWKMLDVNNWSPSDGDAVNLYLFDDMEGRIGNRKYTPNPSVANTNDDQSVSSVSVDAESKAVIAEAQKTEPVYDRDAEFKRRVDFVGTALRNGNYTAVDQNTFDGINIKIVIEVVKPKYSDAESFINYTIKDKRNNMIVDVVDNLTSELKSVTEQLRLRVKELNLIYQNQQVKDEPIIGTKSEVVEKDQRNNNEFQVPYQAASKVGEPTTMIPINMAGSTYAALNALEKEVGSVDSYVGDKLEYEFEELARYFSPEQVDALALSIHAAENNRGIINADQTGIGKGRWVAAMMRYAHINGMTPVFTTIKPELFTDIFRDINDIGSLDKFKKVFIFNDGEDVKKYGTADEVLFPATNRNDRAKAIKDGAIDDDVDMVLATYSQFQRAYEKNPKSGLLNKITSNNCMMVLDESHVAAGASNISSTLGTAVANATAVMYGSATPLKGVSNFAIYNKIFPESVDLKSLPDTLKTGGEALQEAISANMAKDGVIIRREHDFSKLTFHTRQPVEDRTQRNRDYADRLAEITSRLSFMSGDVSLLVSDMNDDFKDAFESIPERDRAGGRMQASSMNFGSRLHAINRQFLLGIKIDEAIDAAVDALENGRKPVIAVENTGESLLRQVVARRAGIDTLQAELDEIDENVSDAQKPEVKERRGELMQQINEAMRNVVLDEPPQFRELLEIMLDRIGTIKVTGRYGGVEIKRPDSEGYLREEESVRELISEFPDLALTPIDVIHTTLERQGYPCAEVSGRTASLHQQTAINGLGEVQDAGWGLKFHPKADAVANVAGFQNGTYDAITITRSGSTGISLHSTDRFDDSDIRQRDFIVLQKAQNIAEFLQWLGRVNRKDQVCFPVITSLESGLPAEIRLTMMHNTKLRKLSANTTSNRSNANAEGDMDLLNDVGDLVARQWLMENPDIAHRLDIKLPSADDEDDIARFSTDNMYINKLLGRLMMVSVGQQEKIMTTISSRFNEYVEELEQRGQNPFKVNVYDWNAEVVAVEELQTGVIRAGSSTFDEPVKLVTVRHEEDVYPIRSEKLLGMIKAGNEALMASGNVSAGGSLSGFRDRLLAEQDEYVRSQLPQKIRAASVDMSVRQILENNKDNVAGAKRAKERSDWLISQISNFKPGYPIKYENPFMGSQVGFITKVEFPHDVEDLFLLSHYQISAALPGETSVRHLTLATVFAQGNELVASPKIDPDFMKESEHAKRIAERHLSPFDAVQDGKVERRHYLLEGNLFRACELAATEKLGAPILYTDTNGDRQRAILLRDWITPDAVKALPIGLDAADMIDYVKEYFAPTRDWSAKTGATYSGSAPRLQIFDSSVKSMAYGEGIAIESTNGARFKLIMPGTKARAGSVLTDGRLFDIGEKTPEGSLRLALSGDRKAMTADIPIGKLAEFLVVMQSHKHVGKFFLPEPEMSIIDELKTRYQDSIKARHSENSADYD